MIDQICVQISVVPPEAMLEYLGISVQQARKTLWLGKPKPEESPWTSGCSQVKESDYRPREGSGRAVSGGIAECIWQRNTPLPSELQHQLPVSDH